MEYNILKRATQNPNHFAPIYDKYYSEIFGFVFKRLADEEKTSDVTSIIFYKALFNLGKFKFKGLPFSVWLYRIAINEVNQHFRQAKKETRFVSIDDIQVSSFFEVLEVSINKEERIIELLKVLKPLELELIELRFFEKYSYKEMGQILNLSETNAKTKTFRTLKKLKKIYLSKWAN